MTTTVLVNPLRFATGGTTLSGDYGTNLEGHWAMDESSGTIIDSTGNNNGTYNGALYSQTGVRNNALGFDDVNDFVDLGTSSNLNINGDITCSAWVYIDSADAYEVVVARDDETDGRLWAFMIRNPGTIKPALQDGITNTLLGNSTLSTGTWYHIVWRGDSAVGWDIFVDGVKDTAGPATWAARSPAPSATTNIGRRSYSGSELYFHGRIDEVTIWSRALSDSEITSLYNGGTPLPYS